MALNNDAKIYFFSNCGLGDVIVFLCALRYWTAEVPGRIAYFEDHVGLIDFMGTDAVLPARLAPATAKRIDMTPYVSRRHRMRCRADMNYLGTYLALFKCQFSGFPSLRLPIPPRLIDIPYIAFQPWSIFAENPSPDAVAGIVARVSAQLPWPIVCVGKMPQEAWRFQGVDCSLCSDNPVDLISLVAHAAIVLTPRSASALVAAAYSKPAFIWDQSDGLAWHMNFPPWRGCFWFFRRNRPPMADVVNEVVGALR